MAMQVYSAEDLKELSLDELIGRMDAVRYSCWKALNPGITEVFKNMVSPFRSVTEFMISIKAQDFPDIQRRQLADLIFRYLFQRDLVSTGAGISNKIVYPLNTYSEADWNLPRQWMRNSAVEQYRIVASRIELECFLDLIYFVDRGERMPGQSKFRKFRQWVINPGNPFQCFIPQMIDAYKYDRVHRQKEVHGTTRFARSILKLEVPEINERNVPNPLHNILGNLYNPLLEIMNNVVPNITYPSIIKDCSTEDIINEFNDPNDHFVNTLTEFMHTR